MNLKIISLTISKKAKHSMEKAIITITTIAIIIIIIVISIIIIIIIIIINADKS